MMKHVEPLTIEFGAGRLYAYWRDDIVRHSRRMEALVPRGSQVYARIGPADGGKRPFGLLRQRDLPGNLFDDTDSEQAAIDAGEWTDDVGIFQGKSENGRQQPQ